MINSDNSQIEDLFLSDTPDLVEPEAVAKATLDMDHGDMDMEMADCPLAAALAAETAALEEGSKEMAECPLAAAMAAEAAALEEGSMEVAECPLAAALAAEAAASEEGSQTAECPLAAAMAAEAAKLVEEDVSEDDIAHWLATGELSAETNKGKNTNKYANSNTFLTQIMTNKPLNLKKRPLKLIKQSSPPKLRKMNHHLKLKTPRRPKSQKLKRLQNLLLSFSLKKK